MDTPKTPVPAPKEVVITPPRAGLRIFLVIVAFIAFSALAAVGINVYLNKVSSPSGAIPSTTETNTLTFYHWWTSPGESAALSALVKVFTTKYPDVAVVPASVVGGGGFKMLPTINSLVAANQAPDAFQMHAGYEARPFFDSGALNEIDVIWESEGLSQLVPSVIQDMCRFESHYYSVPVDVHRSNVIWYNKPLLDKYGIQTSKLTTWAAFFEAADKLKSSGVKYPIQAGESWTIAQVFETIIAGEDIQFYEDWINGKVVNANDPRLVSAFETLKKYLTYVNPDRKDTTWDEAARRVISGDSAFTLMGDWANGEFKVANKVYNKDYGTFMAPGTAEMYGLVVDTFQHPKGVAHPVNSDRWLRVVASREGQDAFNPLKGSISARTDSDITLYGPYQQTAVKDFKSAKHLYPSVVHGSGAPTTFKDQLNTIIEQFAQDGNVTKAAGDMTAFTVSIADQYNKAWLLK